VSDDNSRAERARGELVLIIEDDTTLAMGLELNLTAEGYRVTTARDGAEGLKLALEQRPDLVLLDLMLPGMDGFELLRELRRTGREMPVIIVSARGEERDKLEGFGLGADDYLTKPFSLKELLARVDARFRRRRRAPSLLQFGGIRVDQQRRQVFLRDEEVSLTNREYDLLAYLVTHRGRVHSRERLLTEVWGLDYDGTERTVDNFVRNLRVKLEADPSQPRHILTVRGVGYRFEM
jgi:DNA-binding response OmpR family regulator